MTISNRVKGARWRGGLLIGILLWLWGNSLGGFAEGGALRTKGGAIRTKGGILMTDAEKAAAAAYGVEPGDNGPLVADLGFSPLLNGFPFENYGGDYPAGDLTAAEARQLFGDQVCEYVKGQTCFPTPAAQLWLTEMNQAMLNGHCEGMAALSLLFFRGEKRPADYGGATAADFEAQNAALLREIARYWTLQTLEPVIAEATRSQQQTPAAILNTLRAGLQAGTDAYTLGVYGKVGGHALTPYAIEDVGRGKFWVHVYDNNYPGAGKYVEFDTVANTWKYAMAAINPSEDAAPWEGGAGTLDLTSLAVRRQPLQCPFDGTGASCDKPSALTLLVDGKGAAIRTKGAALRTKGALPKELRFEQGRAINEIPGARLTRLKGGPIRTKVGPIRTKGEDRATLLILPPGLEYATTIRGETNTAPEPLTVAAFRPCGSFVLDDLMLPPGAEVFLLFSDSGRDFSLSPGANRSLTLRLAAKSSPAGRDGLYVLKNVVLSQGAAIHVVIEPAQGTVLVSVQPAAGAASAPRLTFDLTVTSVKGDDSQTAGYEHVSLHGEEQLLIETNADGSVRLTVDVNGDGVAERPYRGAAPEAAPPAPARETTAGEQAMFDDLQALDRQATSDSVPGVGANGPIGLPGEGSPLPAGPTVSEPQLIDVPFDVSNK